MTDEDKDLCEALGSAQREADGVAASFESVWAAAERRSKQRRGPKVAQIAALTAGLAALLALGLLSPGDDSVRYVDLDELMGSTSWSAPSDFLLPERRNDIYREIPLLFESTESTGGTLL